MKKKIPPLDLMFLLTETPNSPKHVSALMTFELPPSGGAKVMRGIADAYRAAQAVAPFTYVADLTGAGEPSWVSQHSVDMDRHLHHISLPAGATHDDLMRLVESLHETVLDRNRPGFDVFLVDGLPGNSFALFCKLHHAIVDGASAMALLVASLNEDVKAKRIEPFCAIELTTPRPKVPKGLVDRVLSLQSTVRKQATAVTGLYVGALMKGIGRLVGSTTTGSEPFTAGRTPLNATIQAPRSFATLSLPIAEMRAAGKAFGGTLNDVALTVVDAGVHRYLADLAAPASKPLVAMCPISLREAGDKEATTKVTAMFVPLGKAAASAGERLQAITAGIATAKAELKSMSNDTAMLYAIAAFGLGEAQASLAQQRLSGTGPLANFVLSNVPGCATPMYLNGARMTGLFPVSSIAAGMGLNVTLASYAGSMDFGFVGNGLSLPNLSNLAQYTREAFDELKAAAAALTPAAPPPVQQAPGKHAPTSQAATPATRKPAAKKPPVKKPAAKKAAARKTASK